MPAAWTATTTWPGPATGSGTSSIVKRLSPRQVATFIAARSLLLRSPRTAGPQPGDVRRLALPIALREATTGRRMTIQSRHLKSRRQDHGRERDLREGARAAPSAPR